MNVTVLADALAPVLRELVDATVAPLLARLTESEKRVADLEKAPADIDLDVIIEAAVAKSTAPLEKRLAELGEERNSLVTRLGFVEGFTDSSVAKNEFRPVVDRLAAAEKRLDDLPLPAEPVDLAPLTTLVAGLEEQLTALPNVPTAEEVAALVSPGKDADPEVIAGMVKAAVDALPPVDPAPLQAAINAANAATAEATTMAAAYKQAIADLPKVPTAEEVRALIPTPENGKSVMIEDVRPVIDAAMAGLEEKMVREVRAEIDHGQAVADAIVAAVSKAVDALPKAKDGEDGDSVTIEQLQPLVEKTVAKRVAEIPTPKDGVGLAGALLDQDGALVVTLTDGSVIKLGRVIGKAGVDGLGFEDLEIIDGEMTFTVRFARGDQVKEFVLAKPTLADMHKGVWQAGLHKRGTVVTWGGSQWLAVVDTEAKPETTKDWVLVVKRGRDGKDATEPKALPVVKAR